MCVYSIIIIKTMRLYDICYCVMPSQFFVVVFKRLKRLILYTQLIITKHTFIFSTRF